MLIPRRSLLLGLGATIIVPRKGRAVLHGSPDRWITFDGRLNASGGVPTYPQLLNNYVPNGTAPGRYLLGTGGGYQAPWRVPGVDYAVGVQSGVVLQDPWPGYPGTTTASFAPGFVAQAGGAGNVSSNGIELFVSNAHNTTISGWDFSLHNGVTLHFINGNSSNVTVQNCNFKVGITCRQCLNIDTGSSNFTIQYNTFDGQRYCNGGIGFGLINGTGSSGNNLVQYNLVQNAYSELMVCGAGPGTGNLTIQYNMMANAGFGQGKAAFNITGAINNGGASAGTTLTVSANSSGGVINVGDALTDGPGNIAFGTCISAILSGNGGPGSTYTVNNSQLLASETITVGGSHGDWVQLAITPQGNAVLNNLVIQFNAWVQSVSASLAGAQGLSLQSANEPMGYAISESINNNVFITAGGANTNSQIIINTPNLNGTAVVNQNYADITGSGSPPFLFAGNNNGGNLNGSPYNGTVTKSGNINMVTGASL